MGSTEYSGVKLEWLGHASFRIEKGVTIFVDPFNISEGHADVVLITHPHYDHCDEKSISSISKEGTTILAPSDCEEKLSGRKFVEVVPMKEYEIGTVKIETVPAYNIGKEFHPKEKGWVGYVVEISGVRIYHAGDTDLIPEMENLRNIDIALLPVGGTYTMDAEEAAKAVEKIKPKIAVPMHYGSIVGNEDDARRFSELASCEVRIL